MSEKSKLSISSTIMKDSRHKFKPLISMDKQFNCVYIYVVHTYSALGTKIKREMNNSQIKTAVNDCNLVAWVPLPSTAAACLCHSYPHRFDHDKSYLHIGIYLSIIFPKFLLYCIIFCSNWENMSFMYVKLS